jgi:hypothetical protein
MIAQISIWVVGKIGVFLVCLPLAIYFMRGILGKRTSSDELFPNDPGPQIIGEMQPAEMETWDVFEDAPVDIRPYDYANRHDVPT